MILFADRALLEGMAAPVNLVSCRSHRVKRVGRNVDVCDHNDNRDLKLNPVCILLYFHVLQPSGSRTSLRDQCLFCLCTNCCRALLLARLWYHSHASPPVLLYLGTRSSCSSSAGVPFTITVVAERCPLVEGHGVH